MSSVSEVRTVVVLTVHSISNAFCVRLCLRVSGKGHGIDEGEKLVVFGLCM